MLTNASGDGIHEAQRIIFSDMYRLRRYPANYFSVVVDIGANIGGFTMLASILHPKALVLSYEPCRESFEILRQNTHGLKNVRCFRQALGDGGELRFVDHHDLVCNQCFSHQGAGEATPSRTFAQMLDDNSVDPGAHCMFVKIDCEGGERFLLNDPPTAGAFRQAEHISFEAHFPCRKNSNFAELPDWETYDRWIRATLDATHHIAYVNSRKHNGNGLYLARRN